MEDLPSYIKRFKISSRKRKIDVAWKLVREAARYARHEPYWEFLKENFGVRVDEIKDALRFLEESGELQIKRSIDGKRLYVSTLKDIKENPVRLDRWLWLTSKRPRAR